MDLSNITTTEWFGAQECSFHKEVAFPAMDDLTHLNALDIKKFHFNKLAWHISGGVHLLQFGSSDGKISELLGGSFTNWHAPKKEPTLEDINGASINQVRIWWNDDSLRGLIFLDAENQVIGGDYDDDVSEGAMPIEVHEATFTLAKN